MPIVIFALFLVYQYALKDSVQRALKPRAYAEQAANGDANAAGAGHAEVMPTFTTEQLDAVVVQLLRADSVQSVEVPAAPNTISEFIRNVAPHREAWRRFAKLPAEHVRCIHADLGAWDPKPRYVDVVLSTVTDRWGELRDTLGPPQSKRPSSRVDNSSVWVDLVTDANQTRLEELTGTTWVRYGYLEIVLSTDTPRAYVRGVRIHTDAFLRSHEDAAIADTPAR